ncbi:MAG: hypothetical protein H6843_16805 [Rhodospirillaceae bacterium]|nr:hypothetical protein [Rhodospirillaceae bacterium]
MTSQFQVPDTPPVVQYIADGSETAFAFPFPIIDAGDLQALVGAGDLSASVEIDGVGQSDGGTVQFATPPAAGQVVTLRRAMAYRRTTDFLQGAALRADAFNEAFDRQVMMVQQVADQMGRTLRAADTDLPASLVLPDKAARAGHMLGFDGEGNLQLVAGADAATPYFVAAPGGAARDVYAKLQDAVSVKDFGAVGDGATDDTPAFLAALAGAAAVEVPAGRYRLTGTLTLSEGQSLWGRGEASVLAMETALPLLVLSGGYNSLHHLRLEGGSVGVRLLPDATACVNNVLNDLSLWDQEVGIELDGGTDTNRPCYWNNVHDVLVARSTTHGVHLHVTGAGDTPNANRFTRLRVYSLAAPITGSGIYVEHGRYNNSFTDCEVNLSATAHSCVRVGALTDKTLFVNLYTETLGGVANVLLEAGSVETSITNLLSASAGPAIWDLSGGQYTARNAGYPEKNRLALTRISELVVERFGFDTEFVEPASGGTVEPDLSSSVYLVSSFGGAVTFVLPSAGDANGRQVTVKKIDVSDNPVTVVEDGGSGPDGRAALLSARYEQVTVISNGAAWHVVGTSNPRIDATFHETEAVVTLDPGRPIHLVSAFSGAVTVNLPDPADAQSAGRLLTVKKTDPSGNAVTVTRDGAAGPDNADVTLSGQYDFVSAYCDGAAWWTVGRS